VLEYLKFVQDKPAASVALSHNLRTIPNEDKELLERLAK